MTAQPDTDETDLEPIVGEIDTRTCTYGGVACKIKPLKAREMFGAARIVSAGIGPGLSQIRINWDDIDAAKGELIGLLIVAIPEAGEEVIAFVGMVLEPIHDTEAQRRLFQKAIYDPDFGELIDVLTQVVEIEGPNLPEHAGKVRALARTVEKVAQLQQPKDRLTPTGKHARGRGRST